MSAPPPSALSLRGRRSPASPELPAADPAALDSPVDGAAASRSPGSQTADRGVPSALSPSQPPRSALGPRRGRLSLPGRAASRVPFRMGFPVPPPPSGLEAPSPPSLLSGGSALSVLSLSPCGHRASFPPPCLRGQRPVLSLYCSSLRARVLLSTPRFPGAGHCGNLPAPRPSRHGESSLPSLSSREHHRRGGSASLPPDASFSFLFLRGYEGISVGRSPACPPPPPRRKRSPDPATWWSQPPLFCLLRGDGGYR